MASVMPSTLLVSLAIVLLSGCTTTPATTETSAPTAAKIPDSTQTPPVFASDDEALAAATSAYAAYTTASDSFITNVSDRADTSIFDSLVSSRYLPGVLEGLDDFAKSGRLGLGKSVFDTVSIVSYSDAALGQAKVDLYLCADFSGIRVYDTTGQDVTPGSRPDRVPMQVGFVSSENNPPKLLIDREDSWQGLNFCQ